MFNIISKRKIWFILSATIIGIGIVSLVMYGLRLGIDFRGGALMEIEFKAIPRPSVEKVEEKFAPLDLGEINIQPTGENGMFLRMKTIDELAHQKILEILRDNFAAIPPQEAKDLSISEVIEEKQFQSIGPVIGGELKRKAIYALIVSLFGIVFYIAWAFRKISREISSWKLGIAAILALLHDVLIIIGIFSLLGHFKGIEINMFFVTALLTTLGYSVNDTIVVFDRVRENLHLYGGEDIEDTVNRSVNQTISRSLTTSLTTLFVLISLFLFGGESIRYFALALILGVIVGTYSSIFIASPLLVVFSRLVRRKT